MTIQELLELFEYDRWATDRVLDAAEAAGQVFAANQGASVGSARDLLIHLGDAQLRWLQRCAGEPARRDPLDRYATVAETRGHCHQANARLRDYVASLRPADLEREVHYTNLQGLPDAILVRQLLLQLFAHGVHHRAEACELLSLAGHPPEPVDLLVFYRTQVL
ncbi:MAG: DinB family protein [Chloroflexi bacterium]|nr:DinB family protein [Chloroflexota bacterium]